MPVALNPNDFVYVTLISNRPGWEKDHHGNWSETKPGTESGSLTVAWNGRETELKPGRKTFVQLEAVCNAFGDPRSAATAQAIPIGDPANGERLFIPDRKAEVRRLRLRYSIQDGNDNTFENIHGIFLAPKVKIESESGEEIVSVLEDPDGLTVNEVATTIQQSQNTEALIAHLTRQVDALTKMVEENTSTKSTALDELDTDQDIHPKTPSFTSLDDIPETFDELPNDS